MKKTFLLFLVFWCSTFLFGQQDPETYSSTSNNVYSVVQSQAENTQCSGFRPSIFSFTATQRAQLAALILQYTQSRLNPSYNPQTNQVWLKYDIIAQHVNYNSAIIPTWHQHDNPAFFTWHRDYIQGLEQWLLDKGYPEFVPLPAWDPYTGTPTEFIGAIVPEIKNTPYITAGGMSIPMATKTLEAEEFNMYVVDDLTCGQFQDATSFADYILHGSTTDPTNFDHNEIHSAIGGAMGVTATSPAAAIFWIFHAHVDNLYACYLDRCENCVPPLVRIQASKDRCNLCFNTSLSTNASPVSLRFFNAAGVEIFPERNQITGCITDEWRKNNVKAGDKITARAIATQSACGTDEISSEYSFPTQYATGTGKIQAITLCGGKQTQNRVSPNPVGNGGTTISITNLGEVTEIQVRHTDLQTGETRTIVERRQLIIDEEFTLFVNTENWYNGQHSLVFYTGDETSSVILTKIAE